MAARIQVADGSEYGCSREETHAVACEQRACGIARVTRRVVGDDANGINGPQLR